MEDWWFEALNVAGGGDAAHWYVVERSIRPPEVVAIRFSDDVGRFGDRPCPFAGLVFEGADARKLFTSAPRRRALGLIPSRVAGRRTLARKS
jgi:hypothetical protein